MLSVPSRLFLVSLEGKSANWQALSFVAMGGEDRGSWKAPDGHKGLNPPQFC